MNALIVIDMQDAYFKHPRLKQQKEDLVVEINRLIADFTSRGDLVINVRTIHSPDKHTWTLNMLEDNQGFAFEGADETRILPGLQLDGAIELTKTRDSAFHKTDLLQILRDHNVTAVTLAGVSTHSCIFLTAAEAYANNLKVTIRTEAVDDEDEEMQRQALDYLRREYRQQVL